MSAVVVKCGGSLLDLPDLKWRLEAVLNQVCTERTVLVCGGGKAADQVRKWDEQFDLGAQRSHDLAIAAMSFNARFLLTLSPRFQWCGTLEELETAAPGRVSVIDPVTVVRQLEQYLGQSPERSWDVTSDSIAAWITTSVGAERLVLLKSADAAHSANPDSLAQAELVDPLFPRYAAAISRIDWFNVRGDGLSRILTSGVRLTNKGTQQLR